MLSSDYSHDMNFPPMTNPRKNSQKSADSFKKHKKSNQKMKSANFIIQQLRWNQNIHKNQWSLGLEIDNDCLEVSFPDYELNEAFFGLEDTLIRYFKKGGEIVWDKNNKIDNF